MAHSDKPLEDLSEGELRQLMKHASGNVSYSLADILSEIERRRVKRESTRTFVLSIIAVAVSVLSLLASVLVALFARR